MSTIFVALIVLCIIAAIIFMLVYINNKHAETKKNRFSVILSEFGATYNLSFSKYQQLKKRIIGLDMINKKMAVVEESDNRFTSRLIDLCLVSSCSVKKLHTVIPVIESRKNDTEKTLHSIVLQFEFNNRDKSVSVPFYESYFNSIYEMPELEIKVSEWQGLLAKLIPSKVQKSAEAVS